MRGEPVERIPFIGRMDLWYTYHHNRGSLPAPYQQAELWDIQRELGIGIFGFGAWAYPFYRIEYDGVDVTRTVQGGATTTIYDTPHGRLTCTDVMSEELHEAAGNGARVKFPFKGPQDYGALHWLLEHARIVGNLDAYERSVEPIGEDGVAIPYSGHLPAHELMLRYMGYERFYYELSDRESQVERAIAALDDQQQRILALACQCSAQAIEVGGNYTEQMTPPPIFDRFFASFYRRTAELLNKAGKVLVVHGDGDMKLLLGRLMDCGVQVVEALTPQPMTSIDVADTRRLWQDRVTMWGGIPSVILTPTSSEEQFERYLEDLFCAIAPGDRFILGFGDNVPTDALFHRVRRTAEFCWEHDHYPVQG